MFVANPVGTILGQLDNIDHAALPGPRAEGGQVASQCLDGCDRRPYESDLPARAWQHPGKAVPQGRRSFKAFSASRCPWLPT